MYMPIVPNRNCRPHEIIFSHTKHLCRSMSPRTITAVALLSTSPFFLSLPYHWKHHCGRLRRLLNLRHREGTPCKRSDPYYTNRLPGEIRIINLEPTTRIFFSSYVGQLYYKIFL